MRILLTILSLILFSKLIAQPYKRYINQSFEATNWLDNLDGVELNSLSKADRSDSIAKSGKFSLRFEINRQALEQRRAEIKTDVFPSMNIELWVELYLFLPTEFVRDSVEETFAQWHEFPDFGLGEDYRAPPIALQVNKGEFRVMICSAAAPVNDNNSIDSIRFFSLGNVQRGSWIKWNIYTKLSYTNTGITRIWRNDTLVLDKTNYANYYNDVAGPYLKFGIYKPSWSTAGPVVTVVDKRVLYIDKISVSATQEGILVRKKMFQPWAD